MTIKDHNNPAGIHSFFDMRGSQLEENTIWKPENSFIEKSSLFDAAECFWNFRDLNIFDTEINGSTYLFRNSSNVRINGLKFSGDHSFQSAKNILIQNAHLKSDNALWDTENVTVYNSILDGNFLGWLSKDLRLVNCTIYGSQPLCYADNVVLENCMMVDTDLCFEHSSVYAKIKGTIFSIKNPRSGSITAAKIGEVIIEENFIDRGNFEITMVDMAKDEAL